MDSSIATDPRFRLLATELGWSLRETAGTLFFVWLACYERRSICLTRREANACAENPLFAEAIVGVGLADFEGDDLVAFHGVEERIEFLRKQAEKGRKGGKLGGKGRPKKGIGQRLTDAQQKPNHTKSKGLTYSPSPSPSPSPDPSEASASPTRTPRVEQAVEGRPGQTTPPSSAPAAVEGAPGPQAQHRTLRSVPTPTHGWEVDESKSGAAQELLSTTPTHGAGVGGERAPRHRQPALPFSARDLGKAFARGAQNAFAGDSWDGGLAKPVTSVIRALSLAGRDLSDVERAGRLVKGWRLSEPLTWAWIAKAGNLAGAIAKAHGTEATRAAAQAVRGDFQDWGQS